MADTAADPTYEAINLTRDGTVARIELNRPESMNAWNAQLVADFGAAIRHVADDDGVRVVVLTGAGRGFSAGADLREMAGRSTEGEPDVQRRLEENYHPILLALREMPKPVIAAVNGPAAGIGCSLALCADLVVAAESAFFLLAFANIGLVPDGGSSALVPMRIGFARAIEMAMLAERIPAAKALEWGLINRVVPDAELHTEVDALAARLAAGPTRAYAGIKRQANAWAMRHLADQLSFEAAIQQEMAGSTDFVEGVAAFNEKRPPVFTGG